MVFGDPIKEVIQLNENTVWAGSPNRNDNPDAKEAFPVIRKLLFEGKYKEAHDLVNQKVITNLTDMNEPLVQMVRGEMNQPDGRWVGK